VQHEFGAKHYLTKLTRTWLGLIFVQVLLGAATIWSNKAADVATAHVVTGALSLALGVIGSIILFRFSTFSQALGPSASLRSVAGTAGFGSRPAAVGGIK
jgi:cytochrome c oxidase assembly protein subunit 15